MADDRLWIKVHNGFPEHPKTVGLSDKAFRAVVEFWCYCHRNNTDGKVPEALFNRLPLKVRKELLVDYAVARDGHVEMHDYLEHQMSSRQVKDLSDKRRAAGSLGGKAKANRLANAKQNGIENLPELDIEIELDKKLPKPTPDEFMDWYLAYPRHEARGQAEKAYTKARLSVPADVLLAGAERYAADPNREKAYTKLPATWLNAGCWEDDPLPPREPEKPGEPRKKEWW